MPRLLARTFGTLSVNPRGKAKQNALGGVNLLDERPDFVLKGRAFALKFRDQRDQVSLREGSNFFTKIQRHSLLVAGERSYLYLTGWEFAMENFTGLNRYER